MEQILLAYGLSTETVAAIMIYKHSKVKVLSPDRNMDYFYFVADVLQGDTLAPYLLIICEAYAFKTFINLMKENCFNLTKERRRRYPAQTNTDADYTDDIALLGRTHAQAETLLHSLEGAAGNKTEFVCFN